MWLHSGSWAFHGVHGFADPGGCGGWTQGGPKDQAAVVPLFLVLHLHLCLSLSLSDFWHLRWFFLFVFCRCVLIYFWNLFFNVSCHGSKLSTAKDKSVANSSVFISTCLNKVERNHCGLASFLPMISWGGHCTIERVFQVSDAHYQSAVDVRFLGSSWLRRPPREGAVLHCHSWGLSTTDDKDTSLDSNDVRPHSVRISLYPPRMVP